MKTCKVEELLHIALAPRGFQKCLNVDFVLASEVVEHWECSLRVPETSGLRKFSTHCPYALEVEAVHWNHHHRQRVSLTKVTGLIQAILGERLGSHCVLACCLQVWAMTDEIFDHSLVEEVVVGVYCESRFDLLNRNGLALVIWSWH